MTNKEKVTPAIDRFHLFYVEAIMHDSSFPQIHRVRPVFENITLDEFIDLIEKSINTTEYEVTQQFLYFLLLFREMGHLREYLNSERLNLEILEKLVLFVYGHCTIHDHSTERIIDEVLSFLDNERLMELVVQSQVISKDKLLLFFILSRFDVDLLNKFFSRIRNVGDFIEYFLKLPEDVLRSIISRNYHLFQYIMLMMAESDSEQAVSKDFYEKYRPDIELFSRLNDMVRKLKNNSTFEEEKENGTSDISMNRISFLVNMVQEFPEPEKAVEYFNSEHVFMSEKEKKIVLAIATDPLLRNTFSDYEGMLTP